VDIRGYDGCEAVLSLPVIYDEILRRLLEDTYPRPRTQPFGHDLFENDFRLILHVKDLG
jgi:hypothetical protein